MERIKKINSNVIHIPTYEEIAHYLQVHVHQDDLIITIGAGPINQVAKILLKQQ